MRLKHRLAFTALVTALSMAPALADAAPQTGPNDPRPAEGPPANPDYLMLGAGAIVYRSPFEGEGTSVDPIPIILARRGAFYIRGLEAGVSYAPQWGRDYTPSFDLFIAGRAIAGESREEISGDIGVRASLDAPAGAFSIDYRQDLTGDFEGAEVTVRYEYTLTAGRLSITPGIQANWLDRETANHMYGVSAEQRQEMIDDGVDAILPVFLVRESGVNFGADVTVVMPVTENIIAIGSLGGTYLDSSIRENPGLREDFEAQAMFGLAFRF